MKIYAQQIRRFISIDGYYVHFLIFSNKSRGWRWCIESVNIEMAWTESPSSIAAVSQNMENVLLPN